jgi:hypothetical protein
MKVSHVATLVAVIAPVVVFAQAPHPWKLPHVASGTMTDRGLDYKVPGPKEGYVPDKDTAIKIAEVILIRLYGERDVTSQKPYVVTEDENIWWVCGTLKKDELGSSFSIAISRQTAAVLYLEH